VGAASCRDKLAFQLAGQRIYSAIGGLDGVLKPLIAKVSGLHNDHCENDYKCTSIRTEKRV
jgi:hypothetical protein